MAFNINSLNISFSGGQMNRVEVYFNNRSDDNRNYINGNVELTVEEYLNNATSDKLEPLVKQKVIDFITPSLPAPTEPTEAEPDTTE